MSASKRVLVILAILSLICGSPALAGGEGGDDLRLLRDLHEKLGKMIRWLSQLGVWQLSEGRQDAAVETAEMMEKLVLEQSEVARRLAAAVPKARPKPAPGPPPRPPIPPEAKPDLQPEDLFPEPSFASGTAKGLFGRREGQRNLEANGGSASTQNAVDLALEWLSVHQDPVGFWDSDGFNTQCKLNQCDGAGYAPYDPGVTGLALLAFLGAGETHRHGRYRKTVKAGLKYLKQVQDPEGCFGPRTTNHFTYNHAIGALAMAEAYALTSSPLFKQSAQSAIDFIHKCQNPYLAWRYGVRPGENDTSVTAWMVMALKAAEVAGLRVDQAGFDGAKAWLEKVTEPKYGRAGYTARGTGPSRASDRMDRFPADRSESLTAVGVLLRILIGENPKRSEMVRKGTNLCLKSLPAWNEQTGSIDPYYWFFGTQAMFQVGGGAWKTWNRAIRQALVDHQRREGDEKGSWDPVGPWGPDGGRVYATALGALTLETYYRIGRLSERR